MECCRLIGEGNPKHFTKSTPDYMNAVVCDLGKFVCVCVGGGGDICSVFIPFFWCVFVFFTFIYIFFNHILS